MAKRKTKADLEQENKELNEQVDVYFRAYENIIIIQESIVKGIKQIKLEKRKAKKKGDNERLLMLDGYLKCLYKMSSWINMHDNKEIDKKSEEQ
jgi:hypothetical protein